MKTVGSAILFLGSTFLALWAIDGLVKEIDFQRQYAAVEYSRKNPRPSLLEYVMSKKTKNSEV